MTARLALVSGGTGALGTAICQQLAASGRRVAAIGHPAESDRLDAWCEQHSPAGQAFAAYAIDVADFNSTETALRRIEAELGPIDILINAAGITRDASLRKMTPEAWREVMATNLDSVFNLTRPLIQGMCERGFGRIVNLSSVNGQRGQFGQTNYSAAKAGMHGFTMALAQEVASRGVTVNTVSPGYIDSPMIRGVPEAIREQIRAGIPQGHFGQPSDIARAVNFLSADETAYITGANLPVNGGLYMS